VQIGNREPDVKPLGGVCDVGSMNVALFTSGGTIAMSGQRGGVVARSTGADLTRAVPGLADTGVTLDIADMQAIPSADLTMSGVLSVVAAASEAVAKGARGIVLTQGTDTLEETAYLVDLVWPHPEPFVLTGAMRNPTLAGPDGPANVLAAVRVAVSPAARDLGAVVAFADEIHAARHVRKTHATSTAAFTSPNAGAVGQVIEGEVRVLARPTRQPALARPAADAVDRCRVPLCTMTFDDDGVLLDAAAGDGSVAGLVVAGFGVGHVPSRFADRLEALAARMPVVLTSRTGAGSVLRQTYGAAGSEADLQRRGLINGGLLHPYQARLLLRLLLAGGADGDRLRAEIRQRT
jgi:L-asparaginase